MGGGLSRFTAFALCWTPGSNTSVNAMMEAMGGHVYKTYRLFEKPLV